MVGDRHVRSASGSGPQLVDGGRVVQSQTGGVPYLAHISRFIFGAVIARLSQSYVASFGEAV